jgi:hypothetical protein
VKVIAIAQVQFLAAKQILQERSRLHDIDAVLLQTCNYLPLPIDQAITFGCVPNRLLNSHRDCSCIHRLSCCTDAILDWLFLSSAIAELAIEVGLLSPSLRTAIKQRASSA